MDNTKTTFGDLKVGDKFILPGGRKAYVKTTERSAVNANRKTDFLFVSPTSYVVPEFDATVDDILGSWGKL
jgi:hypothetical protein